MNITEEEIRMLESCQTYQDWVEACKKIKLDRKGHYPPDWWEKVNQSGIMARVLKRLGVPSGVRVEIGY